MISEVLVGGGYNGNPLSRNTVDLWTTSYELNVTSVRALDPDTRFELVDREWAYIVDTSNMQIVWKAFGSFGSQPATSSSAYQGLAEMATRLGITCP